MDMVPGLLVSPQAEMLEDLLREQFGPLPQLAAICRLKRLPSGGYSSTEDLQLVLERRRVANAKERERVSALPRAVPEATRARPPPPPTPPAPGQESLSPPSQLPAPIPAASSQHLARPRAPTRWPSVGPPEERRLLRSGCVPVWVQDSGLVTLHPGPAARSPPPPGRAPHCLPTWPGANTLRS